MKIKSPYLPGLHLLCGRAKESAASRLERQLHDLRGQSPGQWESLFAQMISVRSARRGRVFDQATTFWAFLGQVLQAGSCRGATREVQAQRHRRGQKPISSSNSAYCQARKRLKIDWLEKLSDQALGYLQSRSASDWNWRGRRVLLVDGTSCQLPDTPENQDHYPQSGEQKPGCGMPIMQLIGLFDLANGALLRWARSPWHAHEASLFDVELMPLIQPGEVLVGDRAYGTYLNLCLLQNKGADALMRMHHARKFKFAPGCDDTTTTWTRPLMNARPGHYSKQEWEALPEKLTVRLIRVRIHTKGFRTRELVLATTLMDAPAQELAELYLRRWKIEVCFRDIKTTLGMELLRGKSPAMAEKEALMHLLTYNLLRCLMVNAARRAHIDLEHVSFTGTRDSVKQWTGVIASARSRRSRANAFAGLYQCIAQDTLILRPNRSEPRCVKRRPKGYQLLTKPRHEMTVSPSRKLK